MAIQLSVAVRNARLNAVETAIGASPYLQIRSGAAPASASSAATGTLLVEIPLPADWMADAASGSKGKAGTWTANAAAAGTAGHFRVVDSTKATCHIQGSVSADDGTGDLKLVNTNLAVNQPVTISGFSLTDANA